MFVDLLQWPSLLNTNLELRSQAYNFTKALSMLQEGHKSIGDAIILDRVHVPQN